MDYLRAAAIGVAGLLASCAEGETAPATTWAVRSDVCAAICDTRLRCDDSFPGCETACLSGNHAYFQRVTSAALQQEALCLAAADVCPEPLSELFIDCFIAAGQALEPTKAAVSFCDDLAQASFECGWYDSASSCTQEHTRYAAAALSAGAACRNTSCELLEECIEANLWTYAEP